MHEHLLMLCPRLKGSIRAGSRFNVHVLAAFDSLFTLMGCKMHEIVQKSSASSNFVGSTPCTAVQLTPMHISQGQNGPFLHHDLV